MAKIPVAWNIALSQEWCAAATAELLHTSAASFYAEWLVLATSFCFPYGQAFIEFLWHPFLRRALTLPEALLA